MSSSGLEDVAGRSCAVAIHANMRTDNRTNLVTPHVLLLAGTPDPESSGIRFNRSAVVQISTHPDKIFSGLKRQIGWELSREIGLLFLPHQIAFGSHHTDLIVGCVRN